MILDIIKIVLLFGVVSKLGAIAGELSALNITLRWFKVRADYELQKRVPFT